MEQMRMKEVQEKKSPVACAFTGHRHLPPEITKPLIKKVILPLIQNGVTDFYNGMAIGFDLLAAEAVLSLKKKFPYLRLIACIPCYGQEKSFSAEDKKRYVRILKQADEQVLLSEFYYRGCMQVRDQYMVNAADVLVAYCEKTTGGAAFTVKYCQKKYPWKEIVFIGRKES